MNFLDTTPPFSYPQHPKGKQTLHDYVEQKSIVYREVRSMKMFFIVYSREADEDVVTAFKSSGITGYTKMQEVRGEGKETEPKLGTHIWLFLVLDDDEVPPIKELIKRLKQEHPRAGLKGFLIPLEDCL
jgi:hypothetical protein